MTRPLIVLLAALASLGVVVHSYTVYSTAYFDHGPRDSRCGSITFAGSTDSTSNGVFQELSLPSVGPTFYWVLRGIGLDIQQPLSGPIDMAVYLSGNSSASFYHPIGNPIVVHQFTGLAVNDNQFPGNPNDTATGWSYNLGSNAQTLWVFLNQPPAQPLQFGQSCRVVPNPDTGTGPLHRLGALSSVFANNTFWDTYTQDMSTYPWGALASDPFTTSVALNRWRPLWWLIADLAYDPVAGSLTPSPPPRSASLTPSITPSQTRTPAASRSLSTTPSSGFTVSPTASVGANRTLTSTPSPSFLNVTVSKKKHKEDPIKQKKAGVPVWGWILIGLAILCCIILFIICIAVLVASAVLAKKKYNDYQNDYG